jgi:ribosome maturation factor RimP
MEVERSVTQICDPIARSLGLELVQVKYIFESGSWILRVYADRPGGITIEDCCSMSRELSDVLDVEDLISERYRLEVSSPGLDRPLVKLDDFTRFAGNEVKIKTKKPINEQRNFQGVLIGTRGEIISLKIDGETVEFRLKQIEKANIIPKWD